MAVVYQSGSVAGVVALLGILKDFVVANGGVNNNYSADGSGQKFHCKLGSGFFNFRALVNESAPGAGGGTNIYGILANGSTAYSGALAWHLQTGQPNYVSGGTQYPMNGMAALGTVGTPSPTLNYHLFYVDRPNLPKTGAITGATNASPIVITSTAHRTATGDRVSVSGVGGNTAANGTWEITKVDANSFSLNGSTGNGAYTSGGTFTMLCECVYLIVEYPSGQWQHLLFGQLDKSNTGEVAGGWFLSGSTDRQNTSGSVIHFFGRSIQFGFNGTPDANGYVYCTVDGITGWKLKANSSAGPLNANQMCYDTIRKFRNYINNAPNTINNQSVGPPIGVYVTRDGVNTVVNNTPWTIIGFLPELYYLNIRNITPGGQFVVGSTHYRAFPCYQKSDAAYSVFFQPTQHLGFIIRED